jgi:hypothetical protein
MSPTAKIILAALLICLCGFDAEAVKGPVTVNMDVPAGEYKAVRLRNLPRGAQIAIEVKTDGEIDVMLADTEDYRRFLDARRPLFQGQVDRKLSFSVVIPESDDYFLIFYNRTGKRSRAVTATVAASGSSSDNLNAADSLLGKFEKQFHRLFIFDPFPMGVAMCRKSRAFEKDPDVVLCAEYIQILYKSVGDRNKAMDVLSFSIFHQVSRVLLAQWDHPGAADESAADELAAVLMIMLGQKKRLTGAVENFADNSSVSDNLRQALEDDHHILTVRRTAKMASRLDNPGFVLKWQGFLLPHMQTALLKKLHASPTEWTDRPGVEKELSRREKKVL